MPIPDWWKAQLRAYLEKARGNQRKLAQATGFSEAAIHEVAHGDAKTSRIAIPLSNEAGIPRPDARHELVEQAIQLVEGFIELDEAEDASAYLATFAKFLEAKRLAKKS